MFTAGSTQIRRSKSQPMFLLPFLQWTFVVGSTGVAARAGHTGNYIRVKSSHPFAPYNSTDDDLCKHSTITKQTYVVIIIFFSIPARNKLYSFTSFNQFVNRGRSLGDVPPPSVMTYGVSNGLSQISLDVLMPLGLHP